MARVNWDKEGEGGFSSERIEHEGIYFCEVAGCEERESSKGDPYLSLRFKAPDFDGAFIGFDTIMLDGAGAPMGIAKLRSLGITPETHSEEIQPEHLIGKQCFAAWKFEEYQGRYNLKVDVYAKGSKAGFWPREETPEGLTNKDNYPSDDGDTPEGGDAAAGDAPF